MMPRTAPHGEKEGQAVDSQAPQGTPQVNVNVSTPMVVTTPPGHSLLARILWYVFIGWWLSALVIVVAYAVLLFSLGLLFPITFALLNRVPQALTLRARTIRYRTSVQDGITMLTAGHEDQRPWYWRVLYFVLVGWWLGAVWLVAAWVLAVIPFTFPLGLLMLNRTGGVVTLQRH